MDSEALTTPPGGNPLVREPLFEVDLLAHPSVAQNHLDSLSGGTLSRQVCCRR